jgi:tetratricopeptide (TPR) repeat protein
MPRLITQTDVDAARERAYAGDGVGVSEALRDWAEDTEHFALADDVSRAAVLMEAGEGFAYAGDYAESLRLFEAAQRDGGETYVDPRALMVQSLYEGGDPAAALELADALRVERPEQANTYLVLGGYFELAGELGRAQRWYSMGLRAMDSGNVAGTEQQYESMLVRRRGVRRELELAPDALDEAADVIAARSGLTHEE